jgi:hypothetical protein
MSCQEAAASSSAYAPPNSPEPPETDEPPASAAAAARVAAPLDDNSFLSQACPAPTADDLMCAPRAHTRPAYLHL